MVIETKDLATFRIVLCDESIVVGKLQPPAPAYDKAIAKELQGTTGLSEVVTARIKHIATTSDFSCSGIDFETQYPCALRFMTITIIKDRQCTILVEGSIMLAIEALLFGLLITSDSPDDVTRVIHTVDLQQSVEDSERTEPVAVWQHLDRVEMCVVVAGIKQRTAQVCHLWMGGAPPVEHHLPIVHLLQISHSQRFAIHFAFDVGGRSDVVGG